MLVYMLNCFCLRSCCQIKSLSVIVPFEQFGDSAFIFANITMEGWKSAVGLQSQAISCFSAFTSSQILQNKCASESNKTTKTMAEMGFALDLMSVSNQPSVGSGHITSSDQTFKMFTSSRLIWFTPGPTSADMQPSEGSRSLSLTQRRGSGGAVAKVARP